MPIDVDRYGLITNEFRWDEETDSVLATNYAKARELEIPTNFPIATISDLLADMFEVIGDVRRRFSVELKGTDHFSIDSFAGSVPARYLTAPEFDVENLPVIIVAASINEGENSTTIEVWG